MSDEGKWKFSQCFGDRGNLKNISDANIITSIEFDHTGNFFATGDQGGKIVLFQRNQSKKKINCEYKFFIEFQSHDAEFDYLKSLEIEEKINKIKWIKNCNDSLFLLSSNDKTIKLWKIIERQSNLVNENNLNHLSSRPNNITISSLKLPQLQFQNKFITAQPKKTYSNAHGYHINSISVNSDQETYLSSDDLRINLWNLGVENQSFNIVDIKPKNMEELTEVITSAEFHPIHCNLFIYSSSKGTIKLSDMRSNSLCDNHAKIFEDYLDPVSHNFFTEITSSISDIKFSYNGKYIVSRDYMTIKIWDIAMELKPLKTINVHKYLKEKLCDTYENDAIFDKFEVQMSNDNKSIMTGTYNNNFIIYPKAVNTESNSQNKFKNFSFDLNNINKYNDSDDKLIQNYTGINYNDHENYFHDNANLSDDQEEIVLHADNSFTNQKKKSSAAFSKKKNIDNNENSSFKKSDEIDFKKNILHLLWHPLENLVAIAATNNTFIFSKV